jgi:hypothetical protein
MVNNRVNMNRWIYQQEYKLHELEQIIDNVKEWNLESYNEFINESGQNSNDKKGKLKRVKQNVRLVRE